MESKALGGEVFGLYETWYLMQPTRTHSSRFGELIERGIREAIFVRLIVFSTDQD